MVLSSGLDCHNCPRDHRIDRGCEFNSPIPNRWQIGDQIFQKCPVKEIMPESNDYLRAYGLFRNGFLPNGSGWINESPKYLQAMQTIENYLAKDSRDGRQ